MKAIVSEKGQVTIPKPLRDRLGIRPGQVLDFDVEGGRLVAVKSGDELDALDRLYGSLDIGMSTDEAMRELRGDYEPL